MVEYNMMWTSWKVVSSIITPVHFWCPFLVLESDRRWCCGPRRRGSQGRGTTSPHIGDAQNHGEGGSFPSWQQNHSPASQDEGVPSLLFFWVDCVPILTSQWNVFVCWRGFLWTLLNYGYSLSQIGAHVFPYFKFIKRFYLPKGLSLYFIPLGYIANCHVWPKGSNVQFRVSSTRSPVFTSFISLQTFVNSVYDFLKLIVNI